MFLDDLLFKLYRRLFFYSPKLTLGIILRNMNILQCFDTVFCKTEGWFSVLYIRGLVVSVVDGYIQYGSF